MARSPVILLQITLCLTVLVVETYSSISRTREILHRTKRQAECDPDEFKCTSGECIDFVSMCDGTKECADGSDEFETNCEQLNFSDDLFECTSGEFIQIDFMCDGTKECADGSDETETTCKLVNTTGYLTLQEGGCLLPQTPEFGQYTIAGCPILFEDTLTPECRHIPGTPVGDTTQLDFWCNEGYALDAPTETVRCKKGKWSPKIPVCKTCGRRNWKGVSTPQIAHVSTAKHDEFPWHVGLYTRNASNQWEQICGGSLISPHIVLTAAHCVFLETIRTKLPPEVLKVGLGKYYKEWTHDEPYAVQADVREILIPPRYYGLATGYALDIALLDLTRSVQLNAGIMPVCVDWKREFTITPGMLGTLAGWGKTENGTRSDILLNADLPYIDYRQCISGVSQAFQHYVTYDKFCVNSTNGTGRYVGEGGLTFVHDDFYYVYGIASTQIKMGGTTLTTFTNITNEEIFNWLISSKNKLDNEHDEEYAEIN